MCSEAFLIDQCRALLQALFSGSGLGGRVYPSTLFFFPIPKHQAQGQIRIAVKRSLFGGSTPFFSCKKEKNGVETRSPLPPRAKKVAPEHEAFPSLGPEAEILIFSRRSVKHPYHSAGVMRTCAWPSSSS
ncbi:MAG: hypothetical protein II379_07450, partial [Oscillospiraceae bacterium]|nr:hypothetical protein [Oscillospiraceae bacterium]